MKITSFTDADFITMLMASAFLSKQCFIGLFYRYANRSMTRSVNRNVTMTLMLEMVEIILKYDNFM